MREVFTSLKHLGLVIIFFVLRPCGREKFSRGSSLPSNVVNKCVGVDIKRALLLEVLRWPLPSDGLRPRFRSKQLIEPTHIVLNALLPDSLVEVLGGSLAAIPHFFIDKTVV